MVGSTGTLMTMRIVRSKLRKRDESSTTAFTEARQASGHRNRGTHSDKDQQKFKTTDVISDDIFNKSVDLETMTFTRTSGGHGIKNGWEFPPKAPSPNIYSCNNNETPMSSSERYGFKQFKKQFSGRFKRFISKKETTTPIPPELRPQLKTIYVY